jgi:hypothetical protein
MGGHESGDVVGLFDLARTIAIAKVRLCYGRGDSCNRVVEKLERMSNENYQIPLDLVVKSQRIDIAGVIL